MHNDAPSEARHNKPPSLQRKGAASAAQRNERGMPGADAGRLHGPTSPHAAVTQPRQTRTPPSLQRKGAASAAQRNERGMPGADAGRRTSPNTPQRNPHHHITFTPCQKHMQN